MTEWFTTIGELAGLLCVGSVAPECGEAVEPGADKPSVEISIKISGFARIAQPVERGG
jgi:hypothetical protein